MAKTPYIFTGAGNNFVVFDGREGGMEEYRQPERIQALCREYRTDGLMILTEAPGQDFGMEFYNPDGSGGMMCGNGGQGSYLQTVASRPLPSWRMGPSLLRGRGWPRVWRHKPCSKMDRTP